MSVNKVQLANGETIIDISDSTVTPETLAEGVTAHDASGRKITGKMVPGGGSSVQADWNQTDETAADFIKNKTHYKTLNVIMEEQELAYDVEFDGCIGEVSAPIQDGDVVVVVYDGETYETNTMLNPETGMVMFGNFGLLGLADTGEPFIAMYADGMVLLANDEASHTVKISVFECVKIPEMYLTERKLYFTNDDDYLYTDTQLTTKATIVDIPDNTNFDIGLVSGVVVSRWHRPILTNSKILSMTSGYGTVIVQNGANILELFTAEYTPKT